VAREKKRYRVGIDVGLYSVGFAAIEVDEDDRPLSLLNAMSVIHDSGVDPLQRKTAKTRMAESGLARRTRRLVRRRRKRLKALDRFIKSQGWPIVNLEEEDAWLPWQTRADLVTLEISDPDELGAMLSVALRHMARHRGWRNPWISVKQLRAISEPSEFLEAFQGRVSALLASPVPVSATPAELVIAARTGPNFKLRGEAGLIGGKLHQSDNLNELRAIAERQGLDESLFLAMTEAVFAAQSPKGAAAARVGHDPLPGRRHLPRAAKATLAFQRFRIAGVIGNLRIIEDDGERKLTVAERAIVMELLDTTLETPGWKEVAEALGIARSWLGGTATPGDDGERVSTRPPVNRTSQIMTAECKIKTLRSWWAEASDREQDSLVQALSNAGELKEDSADDLAAAAVVEGLAETELGKLDDLHLPTGRASYSVVSLLDLTKRILESEDDLHYARKHCFGVDDTWTPPVEPIGERIGNPAVDRVLAAANRWLLAAEREWGAPSSINIEHVRGAFESEAKTRERIRGDEQRFARHQAVVAEFQRRHGVQGDVRRSDVRRFQAIQRQNGQCLYCGEMVTYYTAEMDHIVPRAGEGSTNTRDNLVAVCRPCNQEKSNLPFAVWAGTTRRPGVSVAAAVERVNHFLEEDGLRGPDRRRFLDGVKRRLRATEGDEAIDARSFESLGWMANQLHLRVANHFRDSGTTVSVFQGRVTALARKVAGFEEQIALITKPGDERGKSRFDRRHHAVDAAVTAMMRPSVAKTLIERDSLRSTSHNLRRQNDWREYRGQETGDRVLFGQWEVGMRLLLDLMNWALREDRVPVTESLRLRLGSSAAHGDRIRKLVRVPLCSELSAETINRASSPALWCALTREPDYSPEDGLPENPDRSIRLRNRVLCPEDKVTFFNCAAAAIEVRGGYAEIGDTIHHARVYRVTTARRPFYAMIRVFHCDLVQHRKEDLFNTALPPQCISMRTAEPRLVEALTEGRAEYVGWIVEGDELEIDTSSMTSGIVGEFLRLVPGVTRWRLAGFDAASKLRLRPRLLSAEGLTQSDPDPMRKIVDMPSWRPSVDVVFGKCRASVVRRDALGRPRACPTQHVPDSWSAPSG